MSAIEWRAQSSAAIRIGAPMPLGLFQTAAPVPLAPEHCDLFCTLAWDHRAGNPPLQSGVPEPVEAGAVPVERGAPLNNSVYKKRD